MMQRKLRSPALCLLTLAIVVLLYGLARGVGAIGHDLRVNDTIAVAQLNASSSDTGNHKVPGLSGSQDNACLLGVCWRLPETATTSVAVSGDSIRWAFRNADMRIGRHLAPPDEPPRFRS